LASEAQHEHVDPEEVRPCGARAFFSPWRSALCWFSRREGRPVEFSGCALPAATGSSPPSASLRLGPSVRRCVPVPFLLRVGPLAATRCARRSEAGHQAHMPAKHRRHQVRPALPAAPSGCPCPTTTTTSTTVTTTMPCPTTTTLGAPSCQGSGGSCFRVCLGGQTCSADGSGQCVCSGPLQCGVNGVCGGSCPPGQGCLPAAVPGGCNPTGTCDCR